MAINRNQVCRMYVNDRMPTKYIAEYFGCSTRNIRRILSEEGIDIHTSKRRTGQMPINDEFFLSWSHNMAYTLGFILTDGCISGNTLTILQSEPDILYAIRDAMESGHTISKRNNGNGVLYTLQISRKSIVQDLEAFGIGVNKSLTVTMPIIFDEYMPSFIRGVIDGDGWVHPKGYVMTITSASPIFAFQLEHVLSQRNLNVRVTKNSGAYRISVSGKNDVAELAEWLYGVDHTLHLPRKKERLCHHLALLAC